MRSQSDHDNEKYTGKPNEAADVHNGTVEVCSCGNSLHKPLAISVETFCKLSSLKKTATYALINANQLEVCHIGRRTLILMRSVEALLGLNEGHG